LAIDGWLSGQVPVAVAEAPRTPWPKAVRSLLRSRVAGARIVGVSSHAGAHRTVLRLCRVDPDQTVRRAGWDVVRPSLTAEEAERLCTSKFEDARLFALESRVLTRSCLMRMTGDESTAVIQAAWNQLSAGLTLTEARRLLKRRHADIRARAVGCAGLERRRVMSAATGDGDAQVRGRAAEILGELSPPEAIALSHSRHADARRHAIGSGRLSRARLLTLLADPNETTRGAAFDRLPPRLTRREAERHLHKSKHSAMRRHAVRSGLLKDRRLLHLAGSDPAADVRRAAWDALGSRVSAAGAATLSTSPHAEARISAVSSGLLSEARRLELASDPDAQVRTAATRTGRHTVSSVPP
jgi:hypothetical protein